MTDAYLIWSNEHRAWWRAGGHGYSKGLEGAGRYTRARALEICRDALGTAAHLGAIAEIPVRHADVKEFLTGALVPECVFR
jgi:hypothetical protein